MKRQGGDIDKIILNGYWLYRDDLITQETLVLTIDRMKNEEKRRRRELFDEETKKVEELRKRK